MLLYDAQAQGYAASAVVLVAEPKVKEEIDTRVVVFRDAALQALPQQVRAQPKSFVQASDARML